MYVEHIGRKKCKQNAAKSILAEKTELNEIHFLK